MFNPKLFKADVLDAIMHTIAHLERGTVGISENCLWQLTVTRIDKTHGPEGTNRGWVARQIFNEVLTDPCFKNFVYKDSNSSIAVIG